MKFIITLRAARVNSGLTQIEAAELAGVSSDTIRKYELDSRDIPRWLFLKLSHIYGVPDEYIFFGEESCFTGFYKNQKGVAS